MEKIEKLNKVFIPEHIDKYIILKDYTIFEDTWLSAYDLIQDYETKEVYKVLDHQIYVEYRMEGTCGYTMQQNTYKHAALKLDKPINSNHLFVSYREEYII